MNKIEVKVLHESHNCPAGMMMFLAKLTQRGHNIKSMEDLEALYNASIGKHTTAKDVAGLPHGTIKRFTPITVAIVGASRRFLAQARTHQVGMTYVSASLQYSDYSGEADFVIPYDILKHDRDAIMSGNVFGNGSLTEIYLNSCKASMSNYAYIASRTDGDTAGYAAPQGLRNILIISGNHEAWMNFIRLRGCSRNTVETQYVTMLIWEALLHTVDGEEMFNFAGPDCLFGICREGRMSCGKLLHDSPTDEIMFQECCSLPKAVIKAKWPSIL